MEWSPISATIRSRSRARGGLAALALALVFAGAGACAGAEPQTGAPATSDVEDDDSGVGTGSGEIGSTGVLPSGPWRESIATDDGEGHTGDAGDGEPDPARPRFSLHFVDVTESAGLHVHPGPELGAPACLIDDLSKPEAVGDFCFPDRYLGAAAAADYDADGDVDLYLTRADGPDRLMRNDGTGTFVDVAARVGIVVPGASGSAAWLDIEGDGDLDLYVTSVGGPRHSLWVNDGTGRFADEALVRGVALPGPEPQIGMGIAVGDYDRDGDLDLFVAAWRPDKPMGGEGADRNRLLRNAGPEAPGVFEDVTEAEGIDLRSLAAIVDAKPGVYGFAPAFVDLDDDGWLELTLAADFGTSRLWWNDGGHFTEATWESGVGTERNGMGSTFGDVDGDGDLDWFVSAIWTDEFPQLGHRLYRNEGNRTFSDVTDTYGLRDAGWGWGAAFFDADLDGDLDLAMAAGWPYLGYDEDPLRVWLDEGELPWTDRAQQLGAELPGRGRGVLPTDIDRDGDLDMLVLANGAPPKLFRNDLEGRRSWLVVRAPIGARVEVQATVGGPVQVREIVGGTQLFGQPEAVAHFGLGEGEANLERVTVRGPASGAPMTLHDVPRNQTLDLTP